MSKVVIEELDDDLTPEQHFDHLLRFHEENAKKLLTATFAYLKRKTNFFDDPEASKVLARLLRDVNGPAAKPKAVSAAPSSKTVRVSYLVSHASYLYFEDAEDCRSPKLILFHRL